MSSIAQNRPGFTVHQAEGIASEIFGVTGRAEPLTSERDQNFHLWDESGRELVLKIASSADRREVLELQNRAMATAFQALGSESCPVPQPARTGELISVVDGEDGKTHFVRLLSWVPGRFLAEVRPHSPELLSSLGRFVGKIDLALRDIRDPAAERPLPWNMRLAGDVIERHLDEVKESSGRRLVETFLRRFQTTVLPAASSMRASLIHNDANDWNVLVRRTIAGGAASWDLEVGGLIDFGDMLNCWTVADPAIAAAYAVLDKNDPLGAACRVIGGYHSVFPLTDVELQAAFSLIAIRLATSVCLSAHQQAAEPENRYLSVSEQPAWRALEQLVRIDPDFAVAALRSACGLEPSPRASKIAAWIRSQAGKTAPVMPPDLLASSLTIDLSAGSLELDRTGVLGDLEMFENWIRRRLREADAKVGIGRYDEARIAPPDANFEVARDGFAEARTVHLGIDLFAEAGTPVFAPLAGRVRSFQNNSSRYDYGPTLILEHDTDDGSGVFATLYGHLAPESADGMEPGAPVRKGQRIGCLGEAEVNGGWPPHLHFQVISELFGQAGSFPGNAAPSDRELWLAICPDPGPLLGIEQSSAVRPMELERILDVRRERIGRSLSISYRRPIQMVRGYMQYLYSADGLSWLDTVNNVPHVGHCHPRVVEAVQRQAALLNTNTRYLHPNLVRLAERLGEKLPEPLRVCFFVNSGSEANDLALRLARTYTRRKDLLVLEGAYHGNLTSLVEISPYKFDGPGGSGAPSHVHKLPVPDAYRGLYRNGDTHLSSRYAAHVGKALERAEPHGGAAAFICESILSCAGQVVLPEGYLNDVYFQVRRAGGVCIADEVQVGFGRAGSRFWAFELQDVVPDIVTLGKPIGNGHPLGAVITTPEIASAFANGMEYFNTFGGNPVSCAAGLAVLDVIEAEDLQARAQATGEYLSAALRELAGRHDLIGDVRGPGLFLGIELVLDRETLEPAGTQAGYIAERMRDMGILTSTDGPWHNVLKIKPPLPFNCRDADRFVETLDGILREDFVRSSK